MVARPWRGLLRALTLTLGLRRREPDDDYTVARSVEPAPWERAARFRRRMLMLAIAISTCAATAVLWQSQPQGSEGQFLWLQMGLFALLFAWVSAGCVTAVMGFLVLLRGDPHALSRHDVGSQSLSSEARTALIMPICNEDVSTVFAGLRATCESLAASGGMRLFDVFILSDSSDPAARTAELAAWAELRAAVGDAGRIHYRWRQRRTRRKAGNVADFCRRWGRGYRYMVVMDADSVMSGECLLTLVRLMESHPSAGILQTAPQACGHATLHARAQQFASRVGGRLFTAGMQYWQLGEAHYWGHNAIIRVEPFMKHCALAPLPGKGSLSGDILSHDFVEAALMRRAGYHVWLVHDLPGSYEQQPPHLLSELQRDRRWCQGNLQNARLIAEPGLHAVHRAMLVTGAMAYLSAPLWLLYIVLGAVAWLAGGAEQGAPSHVAPTIGMICLWTGTLTMLALPRILGVAAVVVRGEQRFYGGTLQLVKSSMLECALSMLQAPVRMAAHSVFVVGALTGWKLEWKSPPREASDVSWREATRRFAPLGILALGVAATVLTLHASDLVWMAPVGLPLLLAIPLTVLTSRVALGEKLRGNGWLLIPEESWAPSVLRHAWAYARRDTVLPGWAELLNGDLRLFDVVRAAMGPRDTARGLRGHRRLQQVRQVSRRGTADTLTASERMRYLSEPSSLQWLRRATSGTRMQQQHGARLPH
jgi:membrane glycosyltransferase